MLEKVNKAKNSLRTITKIFLVCNISTVGS